MKDWLIDHKNRFTDVQVLTVDVNTGTPRNSNRGLQASKGEWFKYFAGDDVLMPDAIEKCVNFVCDKPEIHWVYAKVISYLENISNDCIIEQHRKQYELTHEKMNKMTVGEQLTHMFLINFLNYPTHFIKKKLLDDNNGFDEDFGLLEDYPTWLKLYITGEKCYYLNEYVMGYRRNNTSVFNNTCYIVNKGIEIAIYNTRKKYLYDKCPGFVKIYAEIRYLISMFFSIPIINKCTILSPIYKGIMTILRLFFTRLLGLF